MEKSIEELIYEETERRLKEMASPDYHFPAAADQKDVLFIAASIASCVIMIILCMTGVIV